MRFGRKFRKIAWKIAVWVVESAVKRLLVSISVQIWEWLTKICQNCVRNWAVLGGWESACWASILLLSMSLYRSVWLRRFGQGWSSLFEGWRVLTQWAKLTQRDPPEFRVFMVCMWLLVTRSDLSGGWGIQKKPAAISGHLVYLICRIKVWFCNIS